MDFIKLLRTLSQITEELNDDRRLAAGVSSAMKFRNVAGRSKNGQSLNTDWANSAITTAFTHKDVLPAVNSLITNSGINYHANNGLYGVNKNRYFSTQLV